MTESNPLRQLIRGTYDIQKLRIQMGNRIVGNFRAKIGLEPGAEEASDAEASAILKDLRRRFKLITDGVKTFPRRATFKGDGVIDTYTELCLIAEYTTLEAAEKEHFRRVGAVLDDYPLWTGYLSSVAGVGPAMGGVIISEIDITRARYPSSLWKYAGLDVAPDGRGRSKRAEHLIEVDYTDKDGKPARRKSITHNPFLKTKLVGVLGSSFLRTGNATYRPIYDNYKHRLEHRPDWAERSKGHRHNAAIRYMIKMFLIDLHREWRAMEGLPVTAPYHETKLRLVHSAA